MTALYISLLQLICVCALGLQSLNVNNGHRLLAALTSVVISITSLLSLSLTIVRHDLSAVNIAAFITGSIVGILASMQMHPWLAARLGRKDA